MSPITPFKTNTYLLALKAGAEPFPGYRLKRRRGKGGFGEVWEAETKAGKRVALKFMPTLNSAAATRELRSIQAIRDIPHPHLIPVDQVWTQAGYLVISMELADGSLAELHEAYLTEVQDVMPASTICQYLTQAALALDHMNGRNHLVEGLKVGYQHCDIKPGNLLLVGETIKLADFGLATASIGASRNQVRAGTIDFAAPEIFQGSLSERSDQFSLAVTYYVLRTGALPFPPGPKTFNPKYVRPAPDLSRLLPMEQPVIRRALSTMPLSRFPTCTAMMSELTMCMTSRG
jgi:serine/threonine protein kinase